MLKIKYHLLQEWPPLAWAAYCLRSAAVITVYHGLRVEVSDNWFCEAVWDGEYHAGDFDKTDLIFGSGGRVRDEAITFVSAGSTLDRLHALPTQDGVWVSNSLAGLLAINNAQLDPSDSRYFQLLGSIAKGFKNYERELPTSAGNVQFMYFNNFKWDGNTLTEVAKPDAQRDFGSFAKYHDFLSSSLGRIATNMSAASRVHPYQLLGTLSSGYDSATNTVLAHKIGLQEVISFSNARSGDADDGKEIAEKLGIKLTLIPRSSWQSVPMAEAPFISSDAKGEDIYFKAAEDHLPGKVLLTGFHGDKVWGKSDRDLDPTIIRSDRSGLSLTEYRLWAGFIHLPLPFMGVRQLKEINAITNSAEMKPWDVPGNYSRPICRRIVEEAGIPRHQFGMSKKAASVLFKRRGQTLTPAAHKAYHTWLRTHSPLWATKGKPLPTKPSIFLDRFYKPFSLLKTGARLAARRAPRPIQGQAQRLVQHLEEYERTHDTFTFIFPFMIEQAKNRYSAYHQQNKTPSETVH